MPFPARYRVASPRTVRMLALKNTKVPCDSKEPSFLARLGIQRKPGPRVRINNRRKAHTAPPSELPTMSRLSVNRGHSVPASILSISASNDRNVSKAKDSSRPLPVSSARSKAPAVTSNLAKRKPYLYHDLREASGSRRCAPSDHSQVDMNAVVGEPVSPYLRSHSADAHTDVKSARAARPCSSSTGARLPAKRRWQGVATSPDEMLEVLEDVLRLESKEAQEERLLTELLGGRIVGGRGEGMYQRFRMVERSKCADVSPVWMTTLF